MLGDIHLLAKVYLPEFFTRTKPFRASESKGVIFYSIPGYVNLDKLYATINRNYGFNWTTNSLEIDGDVLKIHYRMKYTYRTISTMIQAQCYNCGSYVESRCACRPSKTMQLKYKKMLKLIELFKDKQESNYPVFPPILYSNLKLLCYQISID